MPRTHGLLSTAWGTLRRFLGIKAVEQPDTFMSVERRDSLGSVSFEPVEQRDVVQPDSFCDGCQELRVDLPKPYERSGRRVKGTEIWNMRPMKSKDSCRGCALIVEGVKKLGFDEYGYADLRVDYYASRLSVSYMDTTYVFAGREGTENPWGLRPSQRPSFHSTNSKKSIELALEWVRDCAAHKTCQDVTDGQLPTRILDIGRVATDKIVLRETGFERGRYSCLSYCWGDQPFIRTLKKNINDHKLGIAWEKLPPTFQHTIEIVRHLGIRYLWIDALCIVQDDHRDWERESGKMATIYHNSFITISATAATSPHAGLYCTATAVDLGSVSVQLIHHFPNDMKDQRAHRFPVLSRAWTYQERMLAPRVLHFGPEEIFWECYERRCCECAPKQYAFRDEVSKSDFFGRLVAPISDPDGYNAPQNVWRKIVVAYSPLALTVSSDKLPALSGLAEERRAFTKQKYLAGLWEHTLVLDLLWYRSDGYGDELTPVPIELASRAPSWSWASVDGAIMYEQYLYCSGNRMPGSTIFCDILQAECITRSQSTTGTETSGLITLKCSILPVSFRDGRLRLNNNKNSLQFWSDNRADLEHEVLHVLRLAQLEIYNNGEYMLVVKPSDPHQNTFMKFNGQRRRKSPSSRLEFIGFNVESQLWKEVNLLTLNVRKRKISDIRSALMSEVLKRSINSLLGHFPADRMFSPVFNILSRRRSFLSQALHVTDTIQVSGNSTATYRSSITNNLVLTVPASDRWSKVDETDSNGNEEAYVGNDSAPAKDTGEATSMATQRSRNLEDKCASLHFLLYFKNIGLAEIV